MGICHIFGNSSYAVSVQAFSGQQFGLQCHMVYGKLIGWKLGTPPGLRSS